MTTAANTPGLSPLPEKKRYEWIDNARIVAAFMIMYVHLPFFAEFTGALSNSQVVCLVRATALDARVPFFLILAGYFLSRRVTWSKAFDRFLWLLIPYVIWNLIVFCCSKERFPSSAADFSSLVGLKYIVSEKLCLSDAFAAKPVDGPSWFLRDIMVLSLITPIIVKFKKLLAPAMVLAVCCQSLPFTQNPSVMLYPGQVFFYLLGVALVDFRIADMYRIYNEKFVPYALFTLLFIALDMALVIFLPSKGLISLNVIGEIWGAVTIGYIGFLIEKYLPRFSHALAPCGPACFLVFMLHWPFFQIMKAVLPQAFMSSYWALVLPIPTFIIIVAFFLGMKKYTPFLMPYLGHMKMPQKETAPKA